MAERVGPLSVLLDRPCVVCGVRLRDHTAEQAEACCEVVEGWLRPAVPYSKDLPVPQSRETSDDAGADEPRPNLADVNAELSGLVRHTEGELVYAQSLLRQARMANDSPAAWEDWWSDVRRFLEWGSPMSADGPGEEPEGAGVAAPATTPSVRVGTDPHDSAADDVVAAPAQGEVCIVMYPARKAGELSYLYGVWTTKDEATKEYLAEGPAEKDAPSFIVAPVHGSAPSASPDLRNHLVCHDRDCTNAALWCTEHRSVSGPSAEGRIARMAREAGIEAPIRPDSENEVSSPRSDDDVGHALPDICPVMWAGHTHTHKCRMAPGHPHFHACECNSTLHLATGSAEAELEVDAALVCHACKASMNEATMELRCPCGNDSWYRPSTADGVAE